MNKLHLLKPNVKSRYIGENKDEKVKLLYVPFFINERMLSEDIMASAKHFEGVQEALGKKDSDFRCSLCYE